MSRKATTSAAAPGAARPRCRRRRRPSAGGSSSRPVTATTGRPAAASSSSRSRVTPGRRLANDDRRRSCRHTGGRTVPQRRHASVPSSAEPDGRVAALAAGQRATRSAGQDPGPARRVVHAHDGAVGRAGGRSAATSRSDVFHGSSRLRSTTSTIGQPARSSSIAGRSQPVADGSQPDRRSDTATPAAPGPRPAGPARRRRRGRATSGCAPPAAPRRARRATTTAARSGHGAHAAARAPITTSTPAAAAAHSCGCTATREPGPAQPGRQRGGPRSTATARSTSTGPRRHGGQQHGQRRRRRAAAAASRRRRPAARPRRRATGLGASPVRAARRSPATFVGGLAVTRNGRSRPAPQRDRRPPASSISSGAGPTRLTMRRSARSRSTVDGAVGGSSGDHPAADPPAVQRHPHHATRRRTSTRSVGDEVVELLVEPGDVGQDPGDERGSRADRPGDAERLRRRRRALKSSSRLTCSHVNSGSARPKWPYAAVLR